MSHTTLSPTIFHTQLRHTQLWQAWHLESSTCVWRGRCGTWRHLPAFGHLLLGGALVRRWWPGAPLDFAWQVWHLETSIYLCFTWQAWHLETSTFISRGRRGTWRHLPAFGVAGRGTWRHLPAFGVAGVALVALGGGVPIRSKVGFESVSGFGFRVLGFVA